MHTRTHTHEPPFYHLPHSLPLPPTACYTLLTMRTHLGTYTPAGSLRHTLALTHTHTHSPIHSHCRPLLVTRYSLCAHTWAPTHLPVHYDTHLLSHTHTHTHANPSLSLTMLFLPLFLYNSLP
ncbi:uncharacterized protein K489DRAFT_110688 [Dissoconium aciculare CBS 342.82]|uniref:Uncharacterized protein n=1 Tax=Dissoconium aciculare CBS 342.82 TaxID=1314786 RepID=A0A6J3ME12_9PEZI|nr:uncharacterized protein K489DRAFT_110688 [Dissoconium aciculare CBS 342.82]KAF1826250.1 hypothetical protein K489DRAFT_110688 [Dissoconium aciculare CBS 342.82]